MKHLLRYVAALAAQSLLTALTVGACGADHASSTGPAGTGGAAGSGSGSTRTSTAASTGSGGADACVTTEVFGGCTGPTAPDGGSGAPGSACETEAECRPACCPCAHGQTLYAYTACTCGTCASVCNPVNDTRAPVCEDAGPAVVGCLSCAQILNVALSNGDQLGPLACAGAATAHWTALTNCVTAACGSACSGVMPTNACVGCFEQPDAMGGCATEAMACTSN